jgi:hypothetical protein
LPSEKRQGAVGLVHTSSRSCFGIGVNRRGTRAPVWAAAVIQNLMPPAPRHLNHQLKGSSRT